MTDRAELLTISDEPIYNAKAVNRQTGVTPATLGALERRYGILLPDRTAGGHWLYSARDIAAMHPTEAVCVERIHERLVQLGRDRANDK